jgi:hypothetical protein
MTEVGTRVWAVRDANQETVHAFGFGTYAGDLPRPGRATQEDRLIAEQAIRRGDESNWNPQFAGYLADEQAKPMSQRVDELLHEMSLNPKIVLDAGGVVWGCECWWGEATDSTPQEWAKGRRIVTVAAPHPAERESSDG